MVTGDLVKVCARADVSGTELGHRPRLLSVPSLSQCQLITCAKYMQGQDRVENKPLLTTTTTITRFMVTVTITVRHLCLLAV
ncbi:hypothetical protein J6590_042353 [Homalodisca vitripennis]|nr:hypothetical protein J6590_042353 [Homalodisca vitripennis]